MAEMLDLKIFINFPAAYVQGIKNFIYTLITDFKSINKLACFFSC